MRLRYLVAALLVGVGVALSLAPWQWSPWKFLTGSGSTRIEEATILERLRSVASLVTTEVALRDVVTYENTRLGSTKRSLVVATGKALVGFDLGNDARAKVDDSAKRIYLTLPHATLISIDIVQLQTYDESRGLWNPFHPADRDTIYQLARARLASSARELGVRAHAEAGARSVFAALFASSGYEVDVAFAPPPRDEAP